MKNSMTSFTGCYTPKELFELEDVGKTLRSFLYPGAWQVPGNPDDTIPQTSIFVLQGQYGVGAGIHVSNHELPMIERTGKAAPSMRLSGFGVTADPILQRVGSDFLNARDAIRNFAHCTVLFLEFCRLEKKNGKLAQEEWIKLFDDKSKSERDHLFGKVLIELYHFISGFFREYEDDTTFDALIKEQWREAAWRVFRQRWAGELGVPDLHIFRIAWNASVASLDKNSPPENDPGNVLEKNKTEWVKQKLAKWKNHIGPAKQEALMLLNDALRCSIHIAEHFRKLPPDAQNIIWQGCGDVSMNKWKIAFLGERESHKQFVHVSEEPLENRAYSCLVAWNKFVSAEDLLKWEKAGCLVNAGPAGKPSLSVGIFRFDHYSHGDERVMLVTAEGKNEPVANFIDFAVYGQMMVWEGKERTPRQVIREFSDVRHILDLPSLNLNDKRFPLARLEELVESADASLNLNLQHLTQKYFSIKTREFFGLPAEKDVWLGESTFLRNDGALAREACEHPVEIPLEDLGASKDWITVCLLHHDYGYAPNRDALQSKGGPGFFTWDDENRLVWFPRMATYPCTLVGIGQFKGRKADEGGDLFLLAWGHTYKQFTILQCAKMLCEMGARAVLLIDEGNDVFHCFFEKKKDVEQSFQTDQTASSAIVTPQRPRLRGSLMFYSTDITSG